MPVNIAIERRILFHKEILQVGVLKPVNRKIVINQGGILVTKEISIGADRTGGTVAEKQWWFPRNLDSGPSYRNERRLQSETFPVVLENDRGKPIKLNVVMTAVGSDLPEPASSHHPLAELVRRTIFNQT